MSIKEINGNGKSKVISRNVGVLKTPNNGISNKANISAPSHSKKPMVNLGHANHANT